MCIFNIGNINMIIKKNLKIEVWIFEKVDWVGIDGELKILD